MTTRQETARTPSWSETFTKSAWQVRTTELQVLFSAINDYKNGILGNTVKAKRSMVKGYRL